MNKIKRAISIGVFTLPLISWGCLDYGYDYKINEIPIENYNPLRTDKFLEKAPEPETRISVNIREEKEYTKIQGKAFDSFVSENELSFVVHTQYGPKKVFVEKCCGINLQGLETLIVHENFVEINVPQKEIGNPEYRIKADEVRFPGFADYGSK